MAAIWFLEFEREPTPSVCVCCGEPATAVESVRYTWVPFYVIGFDLLAAFDLVAQFAGTRQFTLELPACTFHHTRLKLTGWLRTIKAFAIGFTIVFSCLTVASMGFWVYATSVGGSLLTASLIVIGVLCVITVLGSIGFLVAWLSIGIAYCMDLPAVDAVGPVQFHLTNVHPRFVWEVEQHRQALATTAEAGQ